MDGHLLLEGILNRGHARLQQLKHFSVYTETKGLDVQGKINSTTRLTLPTKQSKAITGYISTTASA